MNCQTCELYTSESGGLGGVYCQLCGAESGFQGFPLHEYVDWCDEHAIVCPKGGV